MPGEEITQINVNKVLLSSFVSYSMAWEKIMQILLVWIFSQEYNWDNKKYYNTYYE